MTAATSQRVTAILQREDEVFVAECPEVGTASQGDTIEEALADLREATELYLEDCPRPALSRWHVVARALREGQELYDAG